MLRRGRKFLTLRIRSGSQQRYSGRQKLPFPWNLVLYPAKRGAVKQILTSSIDSLRIQPLRAPRNTKEPFTIQPFVQIRVVRGSRLGNYTCVVSRTQRLSAQLASPQCESPLSGGTLNGRMGDLTSST